MPIRRTLVEADSGKTMSGWYLSAIYTDRAVTVRHLALPPFTATKFVNFPFLAFKFSNFCTVYDRYDKAVPINTRRDREEVDWSKGWKRVARC